MRSPSSCRLLCRRRLRPGRRRRSGRDRGKPDAAAVLDQIQVTAQRRVENIQDVPVSVSTVSGEKLDVLESGGTDVRFLSARVPSLNIESSFGARSRASTSAATANTDFRLNTSQPVSLVYDDVVRKPDPQRVPGVRHGQVEALRGPQGSLFGRNSPAGVVKFESVRPSRISTPTPKVGVGSDNMLEPRGRGRRQPVRQLVRRASMLFQRRDDWVKNTYRGPNDGFGGYDRSRRARAGLYGCDGFERCSTPHARRLNGTARLFPASIISRARTTWSPGFDPDTAFRSTA